MPAIARQGCLSTQCNCAVVACPDGSVTVTGNGSPDEPYQICGGGIFMGVVDTPTVDLTKTGTGAEGSPIELSADVKISAVDGNLVTAEADGLAVSCESVQDCVGEAIAAGQGLGYDDAANSMSARPSTDAGQVITFGSDGGIYAPAAGGVAVQDTACVNLEGNGGAGAPLRGFLNLWPGGANMMSCLSDGLRAIWTPSGCLAGRGSVSDPARINTGTWPWPCTPTAAGQAVGCEGGRLYGPPVQQVLSFPDSQSTTPPAGTNAAGYCVTHAYNYTNPDTCRQMVGAVYITAIARVTMQPGAEIEMSVGGQPLARWRNDGPAARLLYEQVVATNSLLMAPGGAQTVNVQVCLDDPSGSGSDVTQIATTARVMAVSQ